MARVVIYAGDKEPSPDAILDAARYDRGMVVDVLEDGQSLGKEGDKNPLFSVVEFPGASVEKLRFLLAGEARPQGIDPDLKVPLRRRVQKLDVAVAESFAKDPIMIEKLVSEPDKMEVHFASAMLAVADIEEKIIVDEKLPVDRVPPDLDAQPISEKPL